MKKKKILSRRGGKKVTIIATPKAGRAIMAKMRAVLRVILIILLIMFIIGLLLIAYYFSGFSANDMHQ